MIGNIIGAVILGTIAGFLARALLPGKQSMSFAMTMLLGIGGAVAGYYIFALIGIGDTDKFDLGGLPGAVIGGMLLLLVYERFVAKDEPTAKSELGAGDKAAARERPGGRDRPAGRGKGRKRER